jgi:hypothetical protein
LIGVGVGFTVLGAHPEPHAAAPTLVFRIRIDAAPAQSVHAVLLRCLIQIEPRRRRHAPTEQERMTDLFGEPERWHDTLHPLVWARTSISVPAFDRSIEIDVPVACTYDFEVAAAKYLAALDGGDVPLLFLFSGTVFVKAENGFRVEQVSWEKESTYRMPVELWRDLMDAFFPGCAWIRIRRESLDRLQRFRALHGYLSWDEVIEALIGLKEAAAP